MKINELIQKLQEARREHGNLTVRYADSDFYPPEVQYVKYEEESKEGCVQEEHVLLI